MKFNIRYRKSCSTVLKIISMALILATLICLVGCNNAPVTPEAEEPKETEETNSGDTPGNGDDSGSEGTLAPELTGVEYIDQLERTVMLNLPLAKVAPYGADASAILFSLVPDKMAGWWEAPTDAKEYFADEYSKLPEFKNADGTLDVDAVKASGAELIVAMGVMADKDELDSIAKTAEIPVIFIASSPDALVSAYRALGGLLAMEDVVEDYVDYITLGLEELTSLSAAIKERKKVYIGGGMDGLLLMDSGILALAGAQNAFSEDKLGKATTVDEIRKIKDISRILFIEQIAYDAAAKSDEWNDMDIMLMNMYDCAPDVLFNWLNPSSTPESILGAKWLANLLYPDIFDYDIVEETKLYYDMFFNVQLTNEQAEAMLAQSSSKPVG